jgi:hypothetical protein
MYYFTIFCSVAEPDPGSGIRCLFDPWIRDPEYVFSGSRIPDLGSRIPRPYVLEIFDNLSSKLWINIRHWPKLLDPDPH